VFRFADQYWLILLFIPLLVFLLSFRKRGRGDAAVVFPDISVIRQVAGSRGRIKRIISILCALEAVIVLVLAMARPQSGQAYHTRTTRGIDIMLALDISSSMGAMDFDPLTRFEAAREVVKDFIANRVSDRIGLVVFAAQSFTLCPLTLDYDILRQFLESAWESRLDDGTAIGSAIATSLVRLRNSDAKSRIVILLTDGMNNQGNIDPLTAARIAAAMGVRIYTIGVGTEGQAPQRMDDGRIFLVETHIDEETLKKVSDATGGKYYRAKNVRELQGIYDEIGALETTKINYREWVEYNELFPTFLNFGLVLLVLTFLLDRTVLRRIP
jgi:Ca-activated chloride channel family protein